MDSDWMTSAAEVHLSRVRGRYGVAGTGFRVIIIIIDSKLRLP